MIGLVLFIHLFIGNILFILALIFKEKFIQKYNENQKIILEYKLNKNSEQKQQLIEAHSEINNIENKSFFKFYFSFIFLTWMIFIAHHIAAFSIKHLFKNK